MTQNDEVITWGHSALLSQDSSGQAVETIEFSRKIREVIAGDREQAMRLQTLQEYTPSGGRIERILCEGEGSRRRSSIGVDEGKLQDVVPVILPSRKAAGVRSDEGHARLSIEMSREIAKGAICRFDDTPVDLHGRDSWLVEDQGGQDSPSSTSTDDQNMGVRTQVMGDRGDVMLEELQLRQIHHQRQ